MSWDLSRANKALICDFVYTGVDPNGVGGAVAQRAIYLTSWTSTLTADARTYTADPDMALTYDTLTGALEDTEVTLRIKDQFAEFQQLTGNRAYPLMTVRIREASWDPLDETTAPGGTGTMHFFTLAQGDINLAEINPDGDEGFIELIIGPCGGSVEREVAPPVFDLCWARFGDPKNCTVDRSLLQETASVTLVAGTILTLDMTGVTAPSPDYWEDGHITLDGVDIKIRGWNNQAPTRFVLSRYPPQSWFERALPQTVTITPGCAKTPVACTFFQGDTLNYKSLGLRMPGRHPLYEASDD